MTEETELDSASRLQTASSEVDAPISARDKCDSLDGSDDERKFFKGRQTVVQLGGEALDDLGIPRKSTPQIRACASVARTTFARATIARASISRAPIARASTMLLDNESNLIETSSSNMLPTGPEHDPDKEGAALFAFIDREVTAQQTDAVRLEIQRRLTTKDEKFKMVHLVRHAYMRNSILFSFMAVAMLAFGTVSKQTAWFVEEPTHIPGMAPRLHFPIHRIWYGPKYYHAGGGLMQMTEWRERACDYASLYDWGSRKARAVEVMGNLVTESGCRDYNEIACRRGYVNGECRTDLRVRSSCPWSCFDCSNAAKRGLRDDDVVEAWCDFRTAVVKNLENIHFYLVSSMAAVLATSLLLICRKFSKVVVACNILSMCVIIACLGYVLWGLSTGSLAPPDDTEDYIEALQYQARDPIFNALQEVTLLVTKYGLRCTSGIGFLWLGWGMLIFSVLFSIAWFGELCFLNTSLSLPRAALVLLIIAGRVIFYLPLRFFFRCLGTFMPGCNTSYTPGKGPLEKWQKLGQTTMFDCLHHGIIRALSDLVWIPFHFMRTLEWDGFLYNRPIASDTEQVMLAQQGILEQRTQSYLAWRRSALVVVLCFGTLTLPIAPMDVLGSIASIRSKTTLLMSADTFEQFVMDQEIDDMSYDWNSSDAENDGGAASSSIASSAAFHTEAEARAVISRMKYLNLAFDEGLHEEVEAMLSKVLPPSDGGEGLSLEEFALSLWMPDDGAAEHTNSMRPQTGRRLRQYLREGSLGRTTNSSDKMTDDEAKAIEADERRKDNQLFAAYLMLMGQKGFEMLNEGMGEIRIYETMIQFIAEYTAFGGVLLAHASWLYLPTSRQWVQISWLVQIFSPLAISLVPARLFIKTREAEELLARVVMEAIDFLSIEEAVRSCWETTQTSIKSINEGRDAVMGFCQMFQTYCNRNFLTRNMCNKLASAEAILNICTVVGVTNGQINWELAEHQVEVFCSGINTALFQKNSSKAESGKETDDGAFDTRKQEAFALMSTLSEGFVKSMAMIVAFQFTLMKIFKILPAILGLVPALIMSAYRFRILVPLVTLPIMFMIVLPLIYCPLQWLLVEVVWQVFPKPLIMAGLFFQCFALLEWTIMCNVLRYNYPMSRSYLNKVLKIMGAFSLLMVIVPIICFASWIIVPDGQIGNIVYDQLVKTLQQPPITLLLEFAVSFVFKNWMARVGSMDFIMQQVVSEHEFEKCIEEMRKVQKEEAINADEEPKEDIDPAALERQKKVHDILQLHTEQYDTLNALVAMKLTSYIDLQAAART